MGIVQLGQFAIIFVGLFSLRCPVVPFFFGFCLSHPQPKCVCNENNETIVTSGAFCKVVSMTLMPSNHADMTQTIIIKT